MTPKEAYETRKAERKRTSFGKSEAREMEMLDMLDRFVTAVESIADAVQRNTA